MDLPHPDGPDTETYSPRAIEIDTESRALISSSASPRYTLLTFSSRITGAFGSTATSPGAGSERLRHQDIPLPFVQPAVC